MKFFALDTETTGLHAHAGDEVLSLAYVVLDEELNELACAQYYAHPTDPSRVSPEAARINGYTADAWDERGAVSQNALYTKIATDWEEHNVSRALPLGHNVGFDTGFLDARAQRDTVFAAALRKALSYHKIDTIGLAVSLDLALKTRYRGSYSLGPLCAHYGIPLEKAHDSLYDIRATVELYRKLVATAGGTRTPVPSAKERFAATVKAQAEKIRARRGAQRGGSSEDIIAMLTHEESYLGDSD